MQLISENRHRAELEPGIAVLAALGMALVLAIVLLGSEISRFDVLASL